MHTSEFDFPVKGVVEIELRHDRDKVSSLPEAVKLAEKILNYCEFSEYEIISSEALFYDERSYGVLVKARITKNIILRR
jgi:hypothetical protein